MWGMKIEYGHKDLSGAVLRRATREGEVAGSNPVRRVAREYYAKFFLRHFFGWFVLCHGPDLAHGKGFAVCPIKGPRQRASLPAKRCCVPFAVGGP